MSSGERSPEPSDPVPEMSSEQGRMDKNRERNRLHARTSRRRKKMQLESLQQKVTILENAVGALSEMLQEVAPEQAYSDILTQVKWMRANCIGTSSQLASTLQQYAINAEFSPANNKISQLLDPSQQVQVNPSSPSHKTKRRKPNLCGQDEMIAKANLSLLATVLESQC